eukprot:m.304790 g.304790  ORF g.304790 m.304790 type:complete len:66 (+) comp16339_c0_seq20:268-465(+)
MMTLLSGSRIKLCARIFVAQQKTRAMVMSIVPFSLNTDHFCNFPSDSAYLTLLAADGTRGRITVR